MIPQPGKHDDAYAYSSAYYSPAESSSGYSPVDDAPSPWSHGERTPSLSPSPPTLHLHSELPHPHPHQPSVELVWMPANMDVPGAPAAAAAARASASQGRKGIVTECHPKHAHGVAHIPPGRTHPDVYLGHAAAAHVSRIVQLPPNQRGSLRFFRYAQA
jgi:hypothetical protein